MSTQTAPMPSTELKNQALGVLARIETVRYAKHPLFIIGVVLLAVTLFATMDDRSSDTWQYTIFPAFFLGVFGCIVAYRQTRSTESSVEVMDAAPTVVTRRTAAICLACLLPGAVSLLFSVGLLVGLRVWPLADWQNPGFSHTEAFVLLVAQPMVACIGGPLLGVAVGRWWRFPGAGVLVGVLLIAAVILSFYGRGSSNPDATLATFLRMLSPMALFSEAVTSEVLVPYVMRFPGSPYAHLFWMVALSGLAAVAAMLYGARGETRARLRRWGMGLVALAIVSVVLSVALGPEQSTVYWRDGSVTNGPSTDHPLNKPIE